jgi:hypothetical protein
MKVRDVRSWWRADQDDAMQRLALTRCVVGLAMVRATWHLPPGSVFTNEGQLLDLVSGRAPLRQPTGRQYEMLRAMAMLSAGAWALGCEHPGLKAVANLSSCAVHWRNARLHDEVWNYNSHLNVFMLALSCVDLSGKGDGDREVPPDVAVALVAALQSYYAWIYFQAGISKLLNGGMGWLDGTTVRGSWAEYGTPLGRSLSKADIRVAAAASIAALAFELSFFPVLLAGRRYRRALGLASLCFHLATKATMDISFWHLSWLAVPLFIADPSAGPRISSVMGGLGDAIRKGRPRGALPTRDSG